MPEEHASVQGVRSGDRGPSAWAEVLATRASSEGVDAPIVRGSDLGWVFAQDGMGNPADGGPSSNYADGDKPEFVAGLVLQDIEEG